MKKRTLTVALFATIALSSCSLVRHVDGKSAGKPEHWHEIHKGDQRFLSFLAGFTFAFIVGFFGSQTDLMIKR